MYYEMPWVDGSWVPSTVKELEAFATEHEHELRDATRAGRFPRDIYRQMGARGWVGVSTPARFGGGGKGVAEYCLMEEECARLGLVAPQVSVQGQRWLLEWGTDEQRARYLTGIASAELIFSESISEPGVGSSLKAMRATARRDGADWVLDGRKTHVNLGAESDVTLVYAMAPEGLTAFLVDTDLPGVTRRQTDAIGLRLIPTADMEFVDVRVPADAVLGAPGRGMDTFLTTFNVSRLGNASAVIGLARRALGDAISYAQQRPVGDSTVTDFQGIQWTVADRYADLYMASLARDRAARLADEQQEHALETTLAKKLAVDAAERTVNDVFALVGGHGLYYDTDYTQLLHDVKVLRVAGGSLEVLRNYVARRVLRDDGFAGLR
jgi:alkylation response protein AidB-like acyl-CoA dehydrogenase